MAKTKPAAPPAPIDRDVADFSAPDTDGITDADLGTEKDAVHPPVERTPSKPPSDAPPSPPFETPELASANGPMPRVCKPTERANKDAEQKRFKIACRNYIPQPVKYILARDEDEAAVHYLKVTKLADTIAKLKKRAGSKADDVDAPELAITALTD